MIIALYGLYTASNEKPSSQCFVVMTNTQRQRAFFELLLSNPVYAFASSGLRINHTSKYYQTFNLKTYIHPETLF